MLTTHNTTDYELVHQHFLFTLDHPDSKTQVGLLFLVLNLLCQESEHSKNTCSRKIIVIDNSNGRQSY